METPHTEAGKATERIMRSWLKRLEKRGEPAPSTPTYNAAYEAVLEELSSQQMRAAVSGGGPGWNPLAGKRFA